MITSFDCEEATLLEGQIVALRVASIVRLTPIMMVSNLANIAATLLALQMTHQIGWITSAWSSLVALYAIYMLWGWSKQRTRPFPDKLSPRVERKAVIFAVLLAALWAYPGLMILPTASPLAQAFLIALCAGMVAGGSIALYPIPPAALAYTSIIVSAHMIGFALTGQTVFWAFALVTAMFFGVIVWSIKRYEQIFVSEFLLRKQLDARTAKIEELLASTQTEASRQREEAEARLAQMQRLDSIGRLTAGIAHDFNNLLASIMGNLELTQLHLTDRNTARFLDDALKATRRGAHLTDQLLSFGRKAMLRPESIELTAAISELLSLACRTFPANIRIETRLSEARHVVHVDPGQLQNALLNLMLNARDALPDGGTIEISTALLSISADHPFASGIDALRPGKYAAISISDDGTGIEADVLGKVFDPFFTTKGVGEGSGLGLAMVYGFVRQSGGHTAIDSVPKEGTTIRMLLPAERVAATDATVSENGSFMKDGGSKRVLIVEDTADVQRVVEAQLRHLGYQTTVAGDGMTALRLLREGLEVELLLTDISMPGSIQGDALVSHALSEGLVDRVLCMSGRPDKADSAAFPGLGGVGILRKPVDMVTLAEAVRCALSSAPSGSASEPPTERFDFTCADFNNK